MGTTDDKSPGILPGTLDLLILRTLLRGPLHGYDIVEFIARQSEDVLRVEEGALYQALHRLELRGLLDSEWGLSSNKRRAKYYKLTAAGRRHLDQEAAAFVRLSVAVMRVLEA